MACQSGRSCFCFLPRKFMFPVQLKWHSICFCGWEKGTTLFKCSCPLEPDLRNYSISFYWVTWLDSNSSKTILFASVENSKYFESTSSLIFLYQFFSCPEVLAAVCSNLEHTGPFLNLPPISFLWNLKLFLLCLALKFDLTWLTFEAGVACIFCLCVSYLKY